MFNNVIVRMATDYALARLSERSTWYGFAMSLAALLHVEFNSAFLQAFIAAGLSIYGLLAVAHNEGIKK